MKLNGTIIITLIDFRREFDLEQFWLNRKPFIRDFHPDRFYYWNENDKQSYFIIKEWIESDISDRKVMLSGLKALSVLVGQTFCDVDLLNVIGSTDFCADIIYIKSGRKLKLPGISMSKEEALKYADSKALKESIHKIEFIGDNDEPAEILINGNVVFKLMSGQCIYVTEINGLFLRVLPNNMNKGNLLLNLINIPGEFCSSLHVIKSSMIINKKIIPNICQFDILNGKLIYSSEHHYVINELKNI